MLLVFVLLAAAAGLIAASCSSSTSSSSKDSESRPGTIVSATPISGTPTGTVGWRIVYRTTTADGAPSESSGTVYAPTTPAPNGQRFVVAWAHPTVGTGQDCAPSAATDPSTAIPGFASMIAQGWVIASTDYTGLGTAGVLPYLISTGEARNIIDSVRAAANIDGTDAGTTYAVWGHSQGGHAALSTPEETNTYAPELHLVGVAGAAPAAELPTLVNLQWNQFVSWVIGSEVTTLWPTFYPELDPTQGTSTAGQQNASRLATTCITSDTSSLMQVYGPFLTQQFFSTDPNLVPEWYNRLSENTPAAAPAIPTFVGQGLLDDVVLPSTTAMLQTDWCAAGVQMTVEWYPDADHFSVPSQSAPDAVTWIAARFAGQVATSTCSAPQPVAPATAPPAPTT